jgi:hypothetical protein
MKTDPQTDPRLPAHKAKSMDAATEEAHDRESRVEEATKFQGERKQAKEMPPDDGEGGSWQRQEGQN